jgi:uncharacterized protein YdeI (YjbR/CyaY-like superfamily)
MPHLDPRVDQYIAAAPEFARPILTHLRQLVHSACPQVEETIKWNMPFFTYKGILCHLAAFKAHGSLGFWNRQLIAAAHPEFASVSGDGLGQFGRLRSLKDLPEDSVLIKYVREAMRLNEAGVKKPGPDPQARKPEPKVPAELAREFKRNPAAAETFTGLSPSHRREYTEWIAEAKRPETRAKRVATAIEWLVEGKTRHWKYAKC